MFKYLGISNTGVVLEYPDIIVLRCDESKNIIILKSFRSRSYNIEKNDAELLY